MSEETKVGAEWVMDPEMPVSDSVGEETPDVAGVVVDDEQ